MGVQYPFMIITFAWPFIILCGLELFLKWCGKNWIMSNISVLNFHVWWFETKWIELSFKVYRKWYSFLQIFSYFFSRLIHLVWMIIPVWKRALQINGLKLTCFLQHQSSQPLEVCLTSNEVELRKTFLYSLL